LTSVTTVITADRLVDGTGAAPIEDPVLVITDGKIVGTFTGRAPEGLVPTDAQVFDLPGCTILPGLIDSHVHLNFPGNGILLEEIMREPEGVLVATAAFAAAKALSAGITTVRDTGCLHSTVFELRRSLELGYGHGPRILACGQPITITGGHTWYLGGEADGVDGLRQKVRDMCKLGANAIKVMASGAGPSTPSRTGRRSARRRWPPSWTRHTGWTARSPRTASTRRPSPSPWTRALTRWSTPGSLWTKQVTRSSTRRSRSRSPRPMSR
jgi:imidazolonepropionase-like amidohydrolase